MWNAAWLTSTVVATRSRETRAPMIRAAIGTTSAATASTSRGCGAAPPAIVCDVAAMSVATADAAAARRSRSWREVTRQA